MLNAKTNKWKEAVNLVSIAKHMKDKLNASKYKTNPSNKAV